MRTRVVLVVCLQAGDGVRDAQESRGLGDVYKGQPVRYEPKAAAGSAPISLPKVAVAAATTSATSATVHAPATIAAVRKIGGRLRAVTSAARSLSPLPISAADD